MVEKVKTCPEPTTLLKFVDGELDIDTARLIGTHIGTCEHCNRHEKAFRFADQINTRHAHASERDRRTPGLVERAVETFILLFGVWPGVCRGAVVAATVLATLMIAKDWAPTSRTYNSSSKHAAYRESSGVIVQSERRLEAVSPKSPSGVAVAPRAGLRSRNQNVDATQGNPALKIESDHSLVRSAGTSNREVANGTSLPSGTEKPAPKIELDGNVVHSPATSDRELASRTPPPSGAERSAPEIRYDDDIDNFAQLFGKDDPISDTLRREDMQKLILEILSRQRGSLRD